MEEKTTMKLQCLFCKSTDFIIPYETYAPQSGEQIQCANCGKTNDYDSLLRVVKRKGSEWVEEQVKAEMDKFSKKIKKMFK